LIPGDFSWTLIPESALPEEPPTEVLSPGQTEVITLPEPPLESEASGSDPDDHPSSSETSPTIEAEEDSSETTDEEDGLMGSQAETTISENVPVEHEVKKEEGQESIAREDKTEEFLNVEDRGLKSPLL